MTIPADEEKHEQPKAHDKPPLDKTASDPIGTKLADASPMPELPARDAGDAGPPPVKPADLAPVKPSDLVATPSKQPRHEQPQRRERPQRRHYAGGGYGGRVCGFSVPVPYIGGITIRGRC